MRLYLDSNVFISFVRGEIDGAFNLRFKDAEDFFARARKLKTEIVVSELFFMEVKGKISLAKQETIETLEYLELNFLVFENADKNKVIVISQERESIFPIRTISPTQLKQNAVQ